eukprot:484886_1
MSDKSLTTTNIKSSNKYKLARRKKKKKKKRSSLLSNKRKVRTTTTNIRVPFATREKSYRDRCQLKKRLKSYGHNVDNFPPINHEHPLHEQYLCRICGNKFFRTHTDLLSHISLNHNSNNITFINNSKYTKQSNKNPSLIPP